MTLSGRRVIVTGGTSGIGRATSDVLAGAGARVVVIDVDEDAGRAVERDAQAANRSIRFRRADVASEAEVSAAVDAAREMLGDIDVAVNAAGIMRGQLEPIVEHEVDTWDSVLDVNLRGAFLIAKHAARVMEPNGRGVIILVGSKAGMSVGSGSFSYGASKGGVHGLMLALDRHLGPKGLRVNELCPGDVDTPLYRHSIDEGVRRGGDPDVADERLRNLATPESVAHVIAFLASDAASAVRGTIFTA